MRFKVSDFKTVTPFHAINVDSCLTVHGVFQNIAYGNLGMFLFSFPFDTSFFIIIKYITNEGDLDLERVLGHAFQRNFYQ